MRMKMRSFNQAICVLAILGAGLQSYASSELAYQECPAIPAPMERLACFDSYIEAIQEHSLDGKLFSPLDAGLDAEGRSRARQSLFAPLQREGLSSHEPNKMLARSDSNDVESLYMDANLSIKYPILTPLVESIFDIGGFTEVRKPRLYLAFSSRFSQYIGSRDSSPVVPRRYNPELFLRTWTGNSNSYWDFGFGHESNGQQINSQEAFELEQQNYINNNQPAIIARDGISRGWDYLSIDWNKQWETGFLPTLKGYTTGHVELRRYLSNGLLQGRPEEYNDWEGQGADPKPRDEYDGLKFSVQYNLVNELCIIACFDRVELTHRTGYADLFQHNTTSLELTSSLLGIPFHIWAMSGYNSDLVDYFDYSNSWGIGMEFTR
ncbi:MAG: hypothetical protein AB8B95_09770 [Pseudohongiellaceae bacterium]